MYFGPSLLRFYTNPSKLQSDLPRQSSCTKRVPYSAICYNKRYSAICYNKRYSPPMTDDLVDTNDISHDTLVGHRFLVQSLKYGSMKTTPAIGQ